MNREVKNQFELDAAIKAGETPVLIGDECFDISKASRVVCNGSSQPRVECNGSSQPRVECNGSSQPRVVCYGSSQPRVECNGSSQPRVVCNGSSQPRVECNGSSQPRVVCNGSSQPRVVCNGSSQPRVECNGSSQPRVECNGSSQPRVVCYGSSQPRVVCYGSSQPRVVCNGSSQPRVECNGSSQPRVVCKGFAQLGVTGPAKVVAGPNNQVQTDGKASIDGGRVIVVEPIRSAAEWCEVYGVPVNDGVAILFKAVAADFHSPNGTDYSPGLIPVARDWDGGEAECGGGLHFSPRPSMALAFNGGAEKFVGCPVALADIAVHPHAEYPSKVKARGCRAATFEVDIDGERVAVAQTAAA